MLPRSPRVFKVVHAYGTCMASEQLDRAAYCCSWLWCSFHCFNVLVAQMTCTAPATLVTWPLSEVCQQPVCARGQAGAMVTFVCAVRQQPARSRRMLSVAPGLLCHYDKHFGPRSHGVPRQRRVPALHHSDSTGTLSSLHGECTPLHCSTGARRGGGGQVHTAGDKRATSKTQRGRSNRL